MKCAENSEKYSSECLIKYFQASYFDFLKCIHSGFA